LRKGFFLRRRFLLLFWLAAMLAGCVTASVNERPSHEGLEDAIKRYWEYRVTGDRFRSYPYERVSLKGRQEIRDAYMRSFSKNVVIKGFEIKEIGKEGSTPEGFTPVRMVLRHAPANLSLKARDFYEIEIIDYWEKIEGRWYHIIVDLAGPH